MAQSTEHSMDCPENWCCYEYAICKTFSENEIYKHDAILIDEYEREITFDQFWNEEIGESLKHGKITDEDWMSQNNIRYSRNWFGEDKKWAEKYNVNFCGNFISEDGLKFCINDFC